MKLQNILESYKLYNIPEGEEQFIEKIVGNIIKELKIPNNVNIFISFKPNIELDPRQSGMAVQSPQNPSTFYLFIKPNLSQVDLVTTLIHELYHVHQMVTGKLKMTLTNKGYDVTWEGEHLGILKYSPNTPWEHEAESKERLLLHKILQ